MNGVQAPDRDEQSDRAADQAKRRRFPPARSRIKRQRLAPIAARTASSLPRERARASCRLATFAQAMSRTQATATRRRLRFPPVIAHPCVEQGARVDRAAGIGGGIFSRQFARDVVEIGPRLFQGYAQA